MKDHSLWLISLNSIQLFIFSFFFMIWSLGVLTRNGFNFPLQMQSIRNREHCCTFFKRTGIHFWWFIQCRGSGLHARQGTPLFEKLESYFLYLKICELLFPDVAATQTLGRREGSSLAVHKSSFNVWNVLPFHTMPYEVDPLIYLKIPLSSNCYNLNIYFQI